MKNRKSIYTIITLLFAIGFYIYDNYSFEGSTATTTSENWTYYIRLDIKLRDLELHQLTLNYEKTKQELQSII